MARVKIEQEGPDGWTRWVPPVMTGYRLICCDCGLSHDMEFVVVKVLRHNEDGTWEHSDPLDSDRYRVLFKARRNNRSTANLRRNKPNRNDDRANTTDRAKPGF
jgi:hypothetical protein